MPPEVTTQHQPLTPEEQIAIDTLDAAVRALPKSLSLSIDSDDDEAGETLQVYKRSINKAWCSRQVASIEINLESVF